MLDLDFYVDPMCVTTRQPQYSWLHFAYTNRCLDSACALSPLQFDLSERQQNSVSGRSIRETDRTPE